MLQTKTDFKPPFNLTDVKNSEDKGNNIGIFIGRFCPIHLGHMKVIDKLLEDFGENHILMLGSCNSPWSLRNFFSYKERKDFIKAIYPNVKIIGLPDYIDDDLWFEHIIDILENITGSIVNIPETKKGSLNPLFYGGCIEEIQFLEERGFSYKLVERFGEESINVSSTEVRDCLIHNRDLTDKIHPLLIEEVSKTFRKRWNEFKRV